MRQYYQPKKNPSLDAVVGNEAIWRRIAQEERDPYMRESILTGWSYSDSLGESMRMDLPKVLAAKFVLEKFIKEYDPAAPVEDNMDYKAAMGAVERAKSYLSLITKEELGMLTLDGVRVSDNLLGHGFIDGQLKEARSGYDEAVKALKIIESYGNILMYLYRQPGIDAKITEIARERVW